MIIENIERKEDIVSFIADIFRTWKDNRSEKEDLWQDCINNWLTVIDESKYESWPWRSKVCDTMSQETADTIASNLRNSLFPLNEDYFILKGIDDIGKQYQEEMTNYLKLKLKNINYQEKMRVFLKQLAVLGNSVVHIPWVKRIEKKKKRILEDGKTKIISANKTMYDCFNVETLDILDVVFDPNKPYTRKSMVIYRTYISLADLKNNSNFDQEAIGLIASGFAEYEKKTDEKQDKYNRAQAFGLLYNPDESDVELLVCYGDFEFNGVVYENYLGVVANGSQLLRFEPNPYWGGCPLMLGTYDPLWFSSYGRGPLEPILGIQELINTFTNQKADILNLIIMGSFAYVNDGIIDPSSLFLKPCGGIEVGDLNNIKILSPNTNVALTYQEIAMLRERGERSTAASNYEVGVPGGGRKTAFEASILKAGSAGRFGDVVKHTGDGVVEQVLTFALDSLKQFKYGSGDINDEVLLGEYMVDYFGADTSIVRQTEMQSLLMFTDILARIPALANALDPLKFVTEFKRVLGLRSDVLRSQEAIDAERVRQEVLQLAMSGGGKQGMQELQMPER